MLVYPLRPLGKGVGHPYHHIRGQKSKPGRHTPLALIRRNGTRRSHVVLFQVNVKNLKGMKKKHVNLAFSKHFTQIGTKL